MSISQNPARFSLRGARFGGDGRATFAVPDLRDKAPTAELTYFIATVGNFPQRD